MEQAPGHGTHLVEALQGLGHPRPMYGTGGGEQSEAAFGVLGRGLGDAPMVPAIETEPAVPFG